LLAADREHLHAIDAGGVFAAELPRGIECFLRQALGFGEFATQNRPHRAGADVEVEMTAQLVLFETVAMAHQQSFECWAITHFEDSGDHPSERSFDQVRIAELLGGSEHLVQCSPDIRKLRD
jgi:hypothetical protein